MMSHHSRDLCQVPAKEISAFRHCEKNSSICPDTAVGTLGVQFLPGLDFYASAIETALNIQDNGQGVMDYTGQTNNALLQKWQELSKFTKKPYGSRCWFAIHAVKSRFALRTAPHNA
jgi:hypothetical protein